MVHWCSGMRAPCYEGWIVPKGGCVLGGNSLVGGGGGVYLVAAA